jgi:hypothetical protein
MKNQTQKFLVVGPGDLQQLRLTNELLFRCGAFCHFELERRFSARAALNAGEKGYAA